VLYNDSDIKNKIDIKIFIVIIFTVLWTKHTHLFAKSLQADNCKKLNVE